jgi:uncharacterized protein (DUF2062 family)
MTDEEQKLRKKYYSGVRRTKYLLRYMPRRSNINRYPVLKWFANHARKRDYLWSFRTSAVTPAFYIGWIVTLLPLVGQSIIGFFLALIFRANLMIVVALQFVSTPVTAVPIWAANYIVGDALIRIVRTPTYPTPGVEILEESIAKDNNIEEMLERMVGAIPVDAGVATGQPSQGEQTDESPETQQENSTDPQIAIKKTNVVDMVKQVIESVKHRNTERLANILFYFFTALILGAVINGVILGFISSAIYKYFSKRNQSPLRRLHLLSKERTQSGSDNNSDDQASPTNPS